MPDRNEKWEDVLNQRWIDGAGSSLPEWQQRIVDEITHAGPRPRLFVAKPREHARPRQTLQDVIDQEMRNISRDMDKQFFQSWTATTSATITADKMTQHMNDVIYGAGQVGSYVPAPPRRSYAEAMDDYLDNGVPSPERTYDPDEQPWWEMPVEEVD